MLLSGSAQYVEELTAQQLVQVRKNKATAVTPFTSTRVAFLVMDNTKPPFNSAAVRQGIAKAIPYQEILSSVYKGFAKPWKSAFIPWFQGSSDKYWNYHTDLKAAAQLLRSVKGQSVTLTYVEGFGSGQLIAVLVQQALNAAGLNCQLQGLLRAQADKLKVTFQIPFFVDDSDSPAVPHPLYNLQYLYTTKAFQNMARYSNSQIKPPVGVHYLLLFSHRTRGIYMLTPAFANRRVLAKFLNEVRYRSHSVSGRLHTRGLRIHDLHTRGLHTHGRGFLRNYGHFDRHLPRRESEPHGNESKSPQLQLRMLSNC